MISIFSASVPAGEYTITGRATGFNSTTVTLTVSGAITSNLVLTLTPPPVFQLTGQFINATSGQKNFPLNGATVVIVNKSTGQSYPAQINVSDSTFSATVPAGEYTIIGGATGFNSSTVTLTVSSAISSNLVLTPTTPPNFQLTGQFINATTGQKTSPLNGATVVIVNKSTGQSYPAQINANDSTFSASVPAGEYTITGGATDFISFFLNLTVSGAISASLILSLSLKTTLVE
jgi:hypothetical protein